MLPSQVYERYIFSSKGGDLLQYYSYGDAFRNLASKNCPLSVQTCSTAEL